MSAIDIIAPFIIIMGILSLIDLLLRWVELKLNTDREGLIDIFWNSVHYDNAKLVFEIIVSMIFVCYIGYKLICKVYGF